jgi:hypothetical protein
MFMSDWSALMTPQKVTLNDLIFIWTHDAVRLAWLEADCNTPGGGKTGYLK